MAVIPSTVRERVSRSSAGGWTANERFLMRGRVYLAGVTIFFVALASVLTWQIAALVDRIAPRGLEQVICSPSSLHTRIEPPETQLTRDFAAVRVLLKDPRDHFAQISRLYEGVVHVPESRGRRVWLAKRSEHAAVFKSVHQRQSRSGSLQREARRIDAERGTALVARIEAGLAADDRNALEAGFREMFAVLLDDLLVSIEERLDEGIVVGRAFAHARRYYSLGLEGYLAVQAPAASRSADTALDAMGRALESLEIGGSSARAWFGRERRIFVRTVYEAVGDASRAL